MMRRPEDHGHFDGDVFVLNEPVEMPCTCDDTCQTRHTLRRIDVSHMVLPDDITRDDVIHAILNPVERGLQP